MHGKRPVLLIALGGNALIRKGQQGTADEQFENLRVPMRQIARLSRRYRIIITHGNGPQVGSLLLQQESTSAVVGLPLEILVAQTQGQIGYMIESTLDSELMGMGIQDAHLVSLISYVVVDPKDPAFDHPTKPIGPTYSAEASAGLGFPIVRIPGGWRRVVVSPEPVTIVEKREIRRLIEMGFIVICCGGGGIPVIRAGRAFSGVDAVIDKDLASAKLAEEVGVDVFVIATDVPGAAVHFGTPRERYLQSVGVQELRALLDEGQFGTGSMGPKIDALLRFVRGCGGTGAITSLDAIEAAVAGEAGTRIV